MNPCIAAPRGRSDLMGNHAIMNPDEIPVIDVENQFCEEGLY